MRTQRYSKRSSSPNAIGCGLVAGAFCTFLLLSFGFYLKNTSESTEGSQGHQKAQTKSSWGFSLGGGGQSKLSSTIGGVPFPALQANKVAAAPSLVLYLLYDSHKDEHQANFEYFRRYGIEANDGNSYVILGTDLEGQASHQLPANAQFIKMQQQCSWGMLGDLWQSSLIDLEAFGAIIVVTSFVRGPFLPAAVQWGGVKWTQLLASKLAGDVKLVAPTISCDGIRGLGALQVDGQHSIVAHGTWQVFAVDKVALGLLRDSNVFKCYDPAAVDIDWYPAGLASVALVRAGYGLDSLMLRYQGVNWTDSANWDCNSGLRPDMEDQYDGVNMHPLEVMFVEVNGVKLRSGNSNSRTAKRYDKWATAQAGGINNISENLYALDPTPFRKEKIAYAKERGPGCFDKLFYSAHSPDLQGFSSQQLWEHFTSFGQFEGRPYRFSCVDLRARGPGCFDTEWYNTENVDLNEKREAGEGFTDAQSWDHFVNSGQYEGRHYRFKPVCGEDIDSPNNL